MSATGRAPPIETDAVVVGAGPVGLFQVFELGLQGIGADVIDSLPFVGGQCVEIYADKPIYDIPGTPRCTGRELVARLQQQIAPFASRFHLDQEVRQVDRQADGRFSVVTSTGTRFVAKVVVIAGGVGSFQPRRLKLDGLTAFEQRQLFYRLDDEARFTSTQVTVIGDDDVALEAALTLAKTAQVTLMHRRDEFRAAPATIARVAAMRAQGRLAFVAAQPSGFVQQAGRLSALTLSLPDGSTRRLPLDALLVLTGLSPKLGPIADWGLALHRKQLVVDTEKFETSEPGIFAVGDVVTYPGKKKLILCGFHEAALAAFAAATHVFPDKPAQLEYTTTSPRLRRLLGEGAPEGQPDPPDLQS